MNLFTCGEEIGKLAVYYLSHSAANLSICQSIFKNCSLKKYIFKIAPSNSPLDNCPPTNSPQDNHPPPMPIPPWTITPPPQKITPCANCPPDNPPHIQLQIPLRQVG